MESSTPDDEEQNKVSRKELDLDQILSQIGDAGRFQIIFSALILVMKVIICWSMLQIALVGATPSWWCVDPTTLGLDNMTLDNTTFQTCAPYPIPYSVHSPSPSSVSHTDSSHNGSERLLQWGTTEEGRGDSGSSEGECVRYYDPHMVTIVSEWDLVCERKHIKAAINSIQMAGVLVGALAGGHFSDTVGRRITCYVTMAIHSLACLVTGFAPTWEVYATFRFFVGASIGSYVVLHFVYVMEFIRHTWRPYFASVPVWAIGAGFLCVVAWRLPHWRYLHFILAALSLPALLGWFISPESLRWLAARGKVEAAERVVQRIARINGRTPVVNAGQQLSRLAEAEVDTRGEEGGRRRYTYLQLFADWRNGSKTAVLGFVWLSMSISYYGILFGVSALSGNVYLNVFLLSVFEAPLNVAAGFLNSRVGRRYTSSGFIVLASLTAFAILLADRLASPGTRGTIISVVAISSRLFTGTAWNCMGLLTAELYPTVIRSLGVGAATTAARIGGILAPFVLEMEKTDDTIKCYVIVGSIMAVSGVSVLFLSETKGKSLADTLHQNRKELDV